MKKLILILAAVLALTACMTAQAAEKATAVFDKSVKTLFEGETLQTVLNLTGSAAEGTVTYSTQSKNLTVDPNGLVTAVSKGRGVIRATVKNGKNTWSATLELTVLRRVDEVSLKTDSLRVTAANDPAIAILLEAAEEDILNRIDENPKTRVVVFSVGKTYNLQGTALPKDASDRNLVYSVSDETILQLKKAVLKPLRAGVCMLTVASKQNPEITEQLVALSILPVTKLTVSLSDSVIYTGETTAAAAAFTPNTASIQSVTWASSNTKIAVVDPNGRITGVSKGTARITATAADGSGRKADASIRVKQQPSEISLKDSAVTVNVGRTYQLHARVLPANADDTAITWTSSDPSVATVNRNGQISAVYPGECTVTAASAAFPEVSAECRVTIQQPVTAVSFRSKSVTVNVGETVRVYWDVSPSNATNPEVALTSSKSSIASVDADGTIHGNKRGTVTVTAASTDGSNRRATIKVNVLQPVLGVHMYSDTVRVGVDESIRPRAVLEPEDASNTNMRWTSADPAYATVSGNNNRPKVTGHRWGTTTITGITEDGGYTTTCTINVGNYDRAIKVRDIYFRSNQIKLLIENESNMNITRFYYRIECFDIHDNPLAVTQSGSNVIDGSYNHMLYEGEFTEHGRFTFNGYVQPNDRFGKVLFTLTGYRTDTGYSHDIKSENRITVECKSDFWVGPTPTPTPVPTPTPTPAPDPEPDPDPEAANP